MATPEPGNTQDFISSFKGFMDKAVAQAPKEEPVFHRSLRDHFGTDPKNLPTVTEEFTKSDHPNLHLALTTLLAREGWRSNLRGFIAANDHIGVKFSNLLNAQHGWEAKEGPVEYINITLHDDGVLACVQAGLYFIHHGNVPLALLVRGPRDWGMNSGIGVELMALEPESAENFLSELRTTMRAKNVY